ncbi:MULTISPECIES: EamA family transporter RarD [Eikenella]|uniref:Transporter n=1 Tax=Eikenella longinqua TaxID=1795827 RepID=A0A1A9RY86_9NEIS|nr:MULTISPECIES: EamA family transporter RarD [Eikenella]OAM29110.1 transporter [Eikenella longinqua]
MPSSSLGKGVLLCLLSQLLFSVLYLFSHWMQPISGTDVFALRMVVMAAGLWLITLRLIGLPAMLRFVRTHLNSRRRWLLFLLGTLDVASQFWLFMWAPVNNEGVNVAMGYFLFPVVMVLAGRFWLKERLNGLQTAALLLAGLGVAHELWARQTFSWTTLWVCLVYPLYYLYRREMKIPALQGLTLDLTLILPFALAYLLWHSDMLAWVLGEPRYWLLLPLLGLASAVSMSLNLKSGQMLPVNLFGMLSYVEPALLFVAAVLVLKTPVAESAYLTYGLIWAGLLLLLVNGWLRLKTPVPANLPAK